MTQQYLAGELSVLLAQLEAAVPSVTSADDVALLRDQAEILPTGGLARVAERALELADDLSWDCLIREDREWFNRLAVVGAELREFGVCAGMLGER